MSRNYAPGIRYESKPQQVANRVQRNAARRKMIAAGKAHKGDNRDVGHVRGLKRGNGMGNLRMQSKHRNRAFPRTRGGKVRKYPR